MIKSPVNLLFTSIGRRVELTRAFRKAYQALQLDGSIVATDIDPLAPALHLADKFYITPRVDDREYIPTLQEICKREQVGLIFPLIDTELPILAAHRSELEEAGACLVLSNLQAIQKTVDKWQTTQFFRELGLPVPHSWLPEELDGKAIEFPVFIKPRIGSAAKHTFKVNNYSELTFFLTYVPNPIVQEYLPGAEITNDVVCSADGELLAVVSRQRIEVRWGEVAKGVTIFDPYIVEACKKIANALPAVGPITVQCIIKNGIPHFTEINARLGGGVPLGLAAGVNTPDWLLARYAGIPVTIPPIGSYQRGLYMTRFDDSFFLDETKREQMASHCL